MNEYSSFRPAITHNELVSHIVKPANPRHSPSVGSCRKKGTKPRFSNAALEAEAAIVRGMIMAIRPSARVDRKEDDVSILLSG